VTNQTGICFDLTSGWWGLIWWFFWRAGFSGQFQERAVAHGANECLQPHRHRSPLQQYAWSILLRFKRKKLTLLSVLEL
jgi:hypothetical protein